MDPRVTRWRRDERGEDIAPNANAIESEASSNSDSPRRKRCRHVEVVIPRRKPNLAGRWLRTSIGAGTRESRVANPNEIVTPKEQAGANTDGPRKQVDPGSEVAASNGAQFESLSKAEWSEHFKSFHVCGTSNSRFVNRSLQGSNHPVCPLL